MLKGNTVFIKELGTFFIKSPKNGSSQKRIEAKFKSHKSLLAKLKND